MAFSWINLFHNLFVVLGSARSSFPSAAPTLPMGHPAPAPACAVLLLLRWVLWASFALPTLRQTISSGKHKLNKIPLASGPGCCGTDVRYVKVSLWTQEIECMELKKCTRSGKGFLSHFPA